MKLKFLFENFKIFLNINFRKRYFWLHYYIFIIFYIGKIKCKVKKKKRDKVAKGECKVMYRK